MNIDRLIAERHSDYTGNQAYWQYFSDAAAAQPDWGSLTNPLVASSFSSFAFPSGLVGFNRYIQQYGLESTENYLHRLQRSVVADICSPAISLYAGTVGKTGTVVTDIPSAYEDIADDADLMGSSLDQFMSDAREKACIHGHVFVLCDSTKASDVIRTEADMQWQGIRPYFRVILPSDVLNWRLDSNGRPIEVLYRINLGSKTSLVDDGKHEDTVQFRYWSKTAWVVIEAKNDGSKAILVDQGTNPIGQVPISVLYHKKVKPFIGESLIKQASRYQALLSNWLSSLDSVMERQSFSQACIRSRQKPSEIGVGSNVVLHLDPGNKDELPEDYFFRSPDAAPLQTMWDAFVRLVSLANKSMSLSAEPITAAAKAESGISKAWTWHQVSKRLELMVQNEQSCVDQMMYLAALWRGDAEFPGSIRYSNRFNLNDLATDIETALSMQALGIPPTARRLLIRDCVVKALPAIDDDTQKQIDTELEQLVNTPSADPAPGSPAQTAETAVIRNSVRQTAAA